ncbi:MAG TPA: PaeR7I family type II restriction endonuclease [Longimicrobiaceae bacterium]|nr:PaeR7I family type II restriction endonuclease [Longimicrobiaceae bacterium]
MRIFLRSGFEHELASLLFGFPQSPLPATTQAMPARPIGFPWTEQELQQRVRSAVIGYWAGRSGQATKQEIGTDRGRRGEVTGGQHMSAFESLITEVAQHAGFSEDEIRRGSRVDVPGYYRPSKQWDILILKRDRLCAALEMKSQVGPSFGNNANNRTEEAIGSAQDLWLAFREGLLGTHPPFLGYFFFLEESDGSTRSVRADTSTFDVDPVFVGASYAKRYEILCERLVLERNYNAASLLLSPRGAEGIFREPNGELSFRRFVKSLWGHLISCD